MARMCPAAIPTSSGGPAVTFFRNPARRARSSRPCENAWTKSSGREMNEVGIPKGTFRSLWTESSSGIDTPKKRANKLALFQLISKCPECRHPVVYPAGPPHPHLRTAGCLTDRDHQTVGFYPYGCQSSDRSRISIDLGRTL